MVVIKGVKNGEDFSIPPLLEKDVEIMLEAQITARNNGFGDMANYRGMKALVASLLNRIDKNAKVEELEVSEFTKLVNAVIDANSDFFGGKRKHVGVTNTTQNED